MRNNSNMKYVHGTHAFYCAICEQRTLATRMRVDHYGRKTCGEPGCFDLPHPSELPQIRKPEEPVLFIRDKPPSVAVDGHDED